MRFLNVVYAPQKSHHVQMFYFRLVFSVSV